MHSTIIITVTLIYLSYALYGDRTISDDKTVEQLRAINHSVIMVMLLLVFSTIVSWIKNHSDYEQLLNQMETLTERLDKTE